MRSANDKAQAFLTQWNRYDGPGGRPLPPPTPEFPFAKHIGRKWLFDWAFPADLVAVEVDGGNHIVRKGPAVGRHTGDDDYDKINSAVALGWRVFRFTPKMLAVNPERCVSQVAAALFGVAWQPPVISVQSL